MDDLISRQAAIDVLEKIPVREFKISDDGLLDALVSIGQVYMALKQMPPAQPELIEQSAYVRGFEQGRTQGMIDAQGGEEMNKQRKVVITITYNEMGIIVDTKAEELGSSAQPEPAIPISWIEEEIKRLESRKSSFAVLDAVQLKVLIKRWESEQNDTE